MKNDLYNMGMTTDISSFEADHLVLIVCLGVIVMPLREQIVHKLNNL